MLGKLWQLFRRKPLQGSGAAVESDCQLTDLDVYGARGLIALARAYLKRQPGQAPVDSRPAADRVRAYARLLEKYNPYAQGILSGLQCYVIGNQGMKPEVVCRPGAHDSLRAEACWYLDAFRDHEDWWSRERELFNRAHRDGEGIIRFYSDEDYDLPCGVTVRPIEPELLQPADGSPEWSGGMRNAPGDVEKIEALNVEYAPGQFEEVPAREAYWIKLNVDRCVKRGETDFAGTSTILDHAISLVKNMVEAEAIRQGILYFTQREDASDDDIRELVAAQSDYTDRSTASAANPGGTPTKIVRGVGEVNLTGRVTLAGVPGAEKINDAVNGLNAVLLACGVRYHMPLWLVSGDLSQNNAVDLDGQSPFGQYISYEQSLFGRHFRNIFWRVLVAGVERGDLPAEVLRSVDIVVKPQQTFGARDPNKEAERRVLLWEKGFISRQSVQLESGYDPGHEDEQIAKEKPNVSVPAPQAQPAPAPAARAGNGQGKPGLPFYGS